MRKQIAIIAGLGIALIAAILFTQFTFPGILSQVIIFELLPWSSSVTVIVFATAALAILAATLATRRHILLGVVSFLILGLLPLNSALWGVRDRGREARMKELQQELEYLRQSEKLPESLADTPLEAVAAGLFKIDRIGYSRSDLHYTIESYGVPLGPFSLYGSERDEWYFEE